MIALVLAALLCDPDFSANTPGAIYDRVHPAEGPGFARTENVYGRRLGDAVALDPRLRYPEYGLGRDGRVTALRCGNARKDLEGTSPDAIVLPKTCAVPTETPSTQILWFLVDDEPALTCGVQLLNAFNGYCNGFRVEWWRSSKEPTHGGSFAFIAGDGKTSVQYWHKNPKDVPAGRWHQLAVVNDRKEFVLYLDGMEVARLLGTYHAPKKSAIVPRLGVVSDRATFKTDSYRIFDEALSAAAIARDWREGQPQAGWNGDEAAARALLPRICGKNRGFFRVGQAIEVKSGEKVLKRVTYDRPGLEELVVDGRRFPLCIVPAKLRPTDIGAVGLLDRQPELMALGIRKSLVTADWGTLEPERRAYDFTALDRQVDACLASGVTPVLMLEGRPKWAARDTVTGAAARQKIRSLLLARYRLELVEPKEVAFVNMNSPATLAATVTGLEKAGHRHIFLTPPAPLWKGVYAAPFAGHPSAAALALANCLAGPCRPSHAYPDF